MVMLLRVFLTLLIGDNVFNDRTNVDRIKKIDFLSEISDNNAFNRAYLSLNERKTQEVDSKLYISYSQKLDDAVGNLNAGDILKKSKGDISAIMSINVFDNFLKMRGKKNKVTKDLLIIMSKLYDDLVDKRVEIMDAVDNSNKLVTNYYIQSLVALGFTANYVIGKSIDMTDDGKMKFEDTIKKTKLIDTNMKSAKHLHETFGSDRNFQKLLKVSMTDVSEGLGVIGMIAVGSVASIAGLFILRKLSWLFFYAKEKISMYFEDVSYYIEQNIRRLDRDKDIKIIESQRRWILRLRKWSNSLEAKDNSISNSSNKEVMNANKSMNNNAIQSNIDNLQNRFSGVLI